MRKLIIAACCTALMGSLSVASAQTTGQPGQDTMKSNDNTNANANAKMMKKKHMKKGMMKGDMEKGGMDKGGGMSK
jgi:pentapeptide MXKDX repeat protein